MFCYRTDSYISWLFLTKLSSYGTGKPKHVAAVTVTIVKLCWKAIIDWFLVTSTTKCLT